MSGLPKIKPLDWTTVGIVSRASTPFGDYVVCDNFWKAPDRAILEVRDEATARQAAEAHYFAIVGALLDY